MQQKLRIMETNQVKKLLIGLGVSSGAILTIMAVGVGAYVVTQYLEAKKLNLEIKLLKRELAEEPIEKT